MSKVFVLGLDGATLDVMMPLIEQGALPAFKEMMKKGAYGPLRSVVPPLSPPAWVSFATGKQPGKHGIIGFTRMVPESYQLALVTGQDNRSRTVWELLGNSGKKVIVLNVPMTYPPQAVNGLMVSGLDTPDVHSDFTYPASLKDEIFSRFPDYKINLQLGGYLQNDGRRRTALRMILNNIDTRQKVTEYLMERHPWDFFVAKFNNPDIVQHHFWKYMDPEHPEYDKNADQDLKKAIFTVYKRLDRLAGSLLKRLDDDTTFMVVSDHGGGARLNKVVYINRWLQQEGYLQRREMGRGGGGRSGMGGLARRVYARLNGPLSFLFHNTSPQTRVFLKNLLPRVFSRLALHFKYSGWMTGVDWNKTTAFLAEQECIRINTEGHFPEGVVTADAYDALRREIIDKLKKLADPASGETVFEDVLTREEAFGPVADAVFPDIQMVTRDAKYDVLGKLPDNPDPVKMPCVTTETFVRSANGMHRPDGIFFIRGSFIRDGIEAEGLRLIDVCPTILAMAGIPIPSDLDGRVIEEVISDDFLQDHPLQWEVTEATEEKTASTDTVYSNDETSLIMDNLKSLGYME